MLSVAMVLTSTVLAQPVAGSWGGYVSGWQSSAPRPIAVRRPLPVVVYVQPSYVLQPAPTSEPSRSRDAEAFAAQERLVAQQATLIAQQQAAQAQLLAQQQQLAAQQAQLVAEQKQREAEAVLARAAEEQAQAQAQAQALKREQDERERAIASREAARLEQASKPGAKGPDVHRWVDEDGVVHYSTKPPR